MSLQTTLSFSQKPLVRGIHQYRPSYSHVRQQPDAACIKMINRMHSRCPCPGIGAKRRYDLIDDDLGHSLVFGGGYGHDYVEHLRSINKVSMFDRLIRFVDETHTYYYKHVRPFFAFERKINSSTTTVLKKYFDVFDQDLVLARMRAKGRMDDPEDKYYRMTDEQILVMWKKNSDRASGEGTEMHFAIERFLNNARRPDDEHEATRQFALFRAWHMEEMVAKNIVPYRTELCMFDEEHEMAGMCDLAVQRAEDVGHPDRGNIIELYDWKCTMKCNPELAPFAAGTKRVGPVDPERHFWLPNTVQKKFNPEKGFSFEASQAESFCHELVDCETSKYFIQLNVYKWMCERAGLTVRCMKIIAFHENNPEPYVIEVPNLGHIVEQMMAERKAAMIATYTAELELVKARLNSIRNPKTRQLIMGDD